MANNKFITPVMMNCTAEEYYKLKEPLEVMGYKVSYSSSSYTKKLCIVNNASGDMGDAICMDASAINTMLKRYHITEYNPELFLALSAMTDAKYGIAGEWWFCLIGSDRFTHGKLYKSISFLNDRYALIDNGGINNGYCPHNLERFRKATKEEIIAHFENLNMVKKVEEPDYTKGYVVKTSNIDEVNIVSSHIKGKSTSWTNNYKYVIFEPEDLGATLYSTIPSFFSNYPLLTFTEFKEKILKSTQSSQSNQNQEKMEKKIIGRKVPCDFKYWNLKKDQKILIESSKYTTNKLGYRYYNDTIPVDLFDSWEPVYEGESKVFEMGIDGMKSFNLTVKEGKCFHKSEDISLFVIKLTDFYNQVPREFAGYIVGMSNVTFVVTGCENVETQLSEWSKVRNEMERTK